MKRNSFVSQNKMTEATILKIVEEISLLKLESQVENDSKLIIYCGHMICNMLNAII